MKIIILNSGRGSRMQNLTKNSTKCMTEVLGQKTILSLQLDLLKKVGFNDVYLTTGYLSNILESYVMSIKGNMCITFVENKDWVSTNYIVSMNNLKSYPFDDDVILMHGDLVFSLEVLVSVIACPGSCVIVDSTVPIPEKDFKAKVGKDGYVHEIGVKLFGDNCMACQPLYKLTLSDWKLWQKSIHEFCQRGETGVYAENALNTITDKVQIHALDVKGKLCMEIDDQNDLARAKELLAKRKSK